MTRRLGGRGSPADLVQGSRMLGGGALKGCMPRPVAYGMRVLKVVRACRRGEYGRLAG